MKRLKSDTLFGISGQDAFFGLLFNEQSDALIKHVGCRIGNGYSKSIFRRFVSENKYTVLASGSNTITYEDPITSLNLPFIYANVFALRESIKEKGNILIQSWERIVRIDILTKEETMVYSKDGIEYQNNNTEIWVSQLLSLGQDEKSIIFISGSIPKTGKSRTAVYNLCKLELNTGKTKVIAQLLDPSL